MARVRNGFGVMLCALSCANVLFAEPPVEVAEVSGTNNNLQVSGWGAPGQAMVRRIDVQGYADRISAPAGPQRRSARDISNIVSPETEIVLDERNLSGWIYAWGQFVYHDIVRFDYSVPTERFDIKAPTGDVIYDSHSTGSRWIAQSRSAWYAGTGTSPENPRQQTNGITAYLDGSVIYGSDAIPAAELRWHHFGLLAATPRLSPQLPFLLNVVPEVNTPLANRNDAHVVADSELFLSGDVRVNENPELTAIHILLRGEHNRICMELVQKGLTDDEEIYQKARAIVRAKIQIITYREWLPALLGDTRLGPYLGYNPRTNPAISNEFAAAAMLLRQTQIRDEIKVYDQQADELEKPIAYHATFYHPYVKTESGTSHLPTYGGILKYLATCNARRTDTMVSDNTRNFVVDQSGQQFDTVAELIQRGRDHGLPDYNTLREAYGLKRVVTWSQITTHIPTQRRLAQAYGDINDMDPWVGIMAEDHLPGGSVGPLGTVIIASQFRRLRDGDRYWYEEVFKGEELENLRKTRLYDILRGANPEDLDPTFNMQENVFFFEVTIGGHILPAHVEGRPVPPAGNPALEGILVRLTREKDGNQETTRTEKGGGYLFKYIHEPGKYIAEAAGIKRKVKVTRGGPLQVDIPLDGPPVLEASGSIVTSSRGQPPAPSATAINANSRLPVRSATVINTTPSTEKSASFATAVVEIDRARQPALTARDIQGLRRIGLLERGLFVPKSGGGGGMPNTAVAKLTEEDANAHKTDNKRPQIGEVTISGKLVLPDDAEALLSSADNSRGGIVIRLLDEMGKEKTTRTNSDGSFTLADIHEAGTYTVSGGGSTHDVQVTVAGPITGIELPLKKIQNVTLSGQLVLTPAEDSATSGATSDAAGKSWVDGKNQTASAPAAPSLEGIFVRLVGKDGKERTSRTSKNGSFQFVNIREPGKYTLKGEGSAREVIIARDGAMTGIDLPLKKGWTRAVSRLEPALSVRGKTQKSETANAIETVTRIVKVRNLSAVTISGRVGWTATKGHAKRVDDKRSLDDILVRLINDESKERTVKSDKTGSFRFSDIHESGIYYVVTGGSASKVEVTGEGPITGINLTMKPRDGKQGKLQDVAISGQFITPAASDGASTAKGPGISVDPFDKNPASSSPTSAWSGFLVRLINDDGHELTTRSEPDGSFRFPVVREPGNYVVTGGGSARELEVTADGPISGIELMMVPR